VSTVTYDVQNRVGVIKLNRPERLNAMNDVMLNDFSRAIADAAADDAVRAVVIGGHGRAFCAGADFRFKEVAAKEVKTHVAEDLRSVHDDMRKGKILNKIQSDITLALTRMQKPTIAMVQGAAAGGGFDIALACDIRVGATDAKFMVAYTQVGVLPDGGGTWLLPRVVGLGRAMEMIYTGEVCDAQEAYRIGILNKMVQPIELEKTTLELATKIANGPPIAHRLNKVMVLKGLNMDLETALQFLTASVFIAVSSEDHKEAINAFVEKRRPVFQDR